MRRCLCREDCLPTAFVFSIILLFTGVGLFVVSSIQVKDIRKTQDKYLLVHLQQVGANTCVANTSVVVVNCTCTTMTPTTTFGYLDKGCFEEIQDCNCISFLEEPTHRMWVIGWTGVGFLVAGGLLMLIFGGLLKDNIQCALCVPNRPVFICCSK